ncbi:MAG: tetratricopeptide repeat protein, partial [Acidobacteriota bacterium]
PRTETRPAQRSVEIEASGKSEAQLLRHLNDALQASEEALHLLPPTAVDDLAVTRSQLGIIYRLAGDLDRALPHFREAVRYLEEAGDFYNAGGTRYNVAGALAEAGRFKDAREYAYAALRDFESFGDGARDMLQKTYELIALIEKQLNSSR